jgi:hypothetical protein
MSGPTIAVMNAQVVHRPTTLATEGDGVKILPSGGPLREWA